MGRQQKYHLPCHVTTTNHRKLMAASRESPMQVTVNSFSSVVAYPPHSPEDSYIMTFSLLYQYSVLLQLFYFKALVLDPWSLLFRQLKGWSPQLDKDHSLLEWYHRNISKVVSMWMIMLNKIKKQLFKLPFKLMSTKSWKGEFCTHPTQGFDCGHTGFLGWHIVWEYILYCDQKLWRMGRRWKRSMNIKLNLKKYLLLILS